MFQYFDFIGFIHIYPSYHTFSHITLKYFDILLINHFKKKNILSDDSTLLELISIFVLYWVNRFIISCVEVTLSVAILQNSRKKRMKFHLSPEKG